MVRLTPSLPSHRGTNVSASPEIKLAALIEMMQSLGSSLALDDVLARVLQSLFKIFLQADRGFIVLKAGVTRAPAGA